MRERQFVVSGSWALGADNLQWILYYSQKSRTAPWVGTSFVSTTRDILERCMKEKGCGDNRAVLLAGLPPTFKEWKETAQLGSPAAVGTP